MRSYENNPNLQQSYKETSQGLPSLPSRGPGLLSLVRAKHQLQHTAVEVVHLSGVGIDIYSRYTGAVLMPQGGGYILYGCTQIVVGQRSPGMSRPVGREKGKGRPGDHPFKTGIDMLRIVPAGAVAVCDTKQVGVPPVVFKNGGGLGPDADVIEAACLCPAVAETLAVIVRGQEAEQVSYIYSQQAER